MRLVVFTALIFMFVQLVFAQPMKSMEMPGMYGQYPMAREASGTSWQPDSTPFEGVHLMRKGWMLMAHGFVNTIYDKQNGKRRDEKTFSTSMFMLMAQRLLTKGTFGFRSMFSLDPAMGKNGYPLLLQTGETADGKTALIDRQHPHDLFMELAGTYSLPLSQDSSAFVYFGLPGEPALGPPVFMHRFSGMDAPGAPATHHWLDSTHITYGVSTLGYVWNNFKVEGSIFRGREPDQSRGDIEAPEFDSASWRLSLNPAENWSMQASFGYIDSPEQLEPNVDIKRATVSISYNKAYKQTNWQTTFAWGRNVLVPGKSLDGSLLESAIRIRDTHTLFSRVERVVKDELFPEDVLLHREKFTVNKITLGYIYGFTVWKRLKWGIGSSFDINILPGKLKQSYGDNPLGYMMFIRLRMD